MKTVIISSGLFAHKGGPTKTVYDFKRALDSTVYSFCERRTFKNNNFSVEDAHSVVSLPLPILSQFNYAKKSAQQAEAAIKESSIVSCHSFYRYPALWTHKVCRVSGVPYCFVPHGILDPWVMRKNRLVKQLYWKLGGQRFIEDASAVIFSTQAEGDKAASQFALPSVEVIPWAVELVDIANREEIRFQIRKRLGIPIEARVLLYFGRLHTIKRPLETIESIAEIKGASIHLVIVGNEDGITARDCMQLAHKLGIKERVHFVGPVYGASKYDYMHAADGYISFSYKENFNYTAAESLAAGLPVILSPGNDLKSELSNFGCFLDIKDNSMQSMVKAIDNFISLSQPKLQEMGLIGRKWVEENLNFDLFKTRLSKLHKKYAKK